MPARRKLSYRITAEDLGNLVKDTQALLDVRVRFTSECDFLADGRTAALKISCEVYAWSDEVGEQLWRKGARQIVGGEFDMVQLLWDLLWGLVSEAQSSYL